MTTRRRRGEPLLFLLVLTATWIGARTWDPVERAIETPVPLPPTVAPDRPSPEIAVSEPSRAVTRQPASKPSEAPRSFTRMPAPTPGFATPVTRPPLLSLPRASSNRSPSVVAPSPPPSLPQSSTNPPASPARRPQAADPPAVPFAAAVPRGGQSRWSGDAWLLVRDKADGRALSVGAASYGASQAGAVVRYRLAPDSRWNPRAHLRTTTALFGPEEIEAAAGVGVRPVAGLPVEVIAEARVGRFAGNTKVRPAIMAVGGIAPAPIAAGFSADAYAQVGYVGGSRGTPFADGQVRVSRAIGLGLGERTRLTTGAGAWGGAQEGASRLDIGPSVAVAFPVSNEVYARAGLDWRERVAGDGEPGSGPVFTLAAGF